MSSLYHECADRIQQLHAAVVELERAAEFLQLPPLAGREWYELLTRKLVPQLKDDAYLVVAIVGGTNIGKSVIFNHIAGAAASATSPLASGTKHPVCLVPPGFAESHDLSSIFRDFQLHSWKKPGDALKDHDADLLFWQVSELTPPNLLVLDTPDIDSDAQVNWRRADKIRHGADVLVAVLTQQKYNDAAVKQFFRKAAAEDKVVIVVFNQCQLPDDEQYWPIWLDTFCGETHVSPEYVYVAPNDRQAAETLQLPFFERSPGQQHTRDNGNESPAESRNLADDLSRLRFTEIKYRTLRGSLNHLLGRNTGVWEYLEAIRERSEEFKSAAGRLSSESVVSVRDWPPIGNALLVDEIRAWWRAHQQGWALQVNRLYDAVGTSVTWPFRFARDKLQGERTPPIEVYRSMEWTTILRSVEEVFEKLTWMSEAGNRLLRPHFERALAGKSRSALLDDLRRRHQSVDLCEELEMTVAAEMKSFETDSPELYRFYRQLNNISAAVRPVTSVVLFTMGWGPAGHALAPFIADAATQAVVPIVADFAGGAAAVVAGDKALVTAAGGSSGYLQAKFRKLHATFTARRVGWLVRLLKEHLLGTLPDELQAAAEIPTSAAYLDVLQVLHGLQEQFEAEEKQTIV